ncbi:hypothetical protein IMG5_104830 [Ichthyophthirius multifiliis]|uniref:Uncharacterized protein n=1 Tax=Ichthyophthirius multifiliis TaxID=5932 RepID=G0QSZ0_ICHMU|nr:hypothetical protein IMG5_104830 [Ichthyophthirius multifiliis]EGR31661.1 hypothetical protein IMG5_104830 [Ichthyophthirius multifiliis]|eukprot:XP_004035147.1 hypothetical protein IMG5_104830 [Ichthyophthirius multifiliis]
MKNQLIQLTLQQQMKIKSIILKILYKQSTKTNKTKKNTQIYSIKISTNFTQQQDQQTNFRNSQVLVFLLQKSQFLYMNYVLNLSQYVQNFNKQINYLQQLFFIQSQQDRGDKKHLIKLQKNNQEKFSKVHLIYWKSIQRNSVFAKFSIFV